MRDKKEESFAPSEAEIAERAALLRRLRRLLQEKRAKFQEYLSTLEAQEASIAKGDSNAVEVQSLISESIVSEIYTIQKALDPIEALSRDLPRFGQEKQDEALLELRDSLESLEKKAFEQSDKNKRLLKTEMERIKGEMLRVKKPRAPKGPYAREGDASALIDIRA